MSTKAGLDDLVKKINKRWGPGTIARASEHTGTRMIRSRTGILSFDIKSGGGLVQNTISTFYGLRSAGKTTKILHAIAEWQRRGETCSYHYTEGIADKQHMESCGVDLKKLLFSQSNVSEECVDLVQLQAMSREVNHIVVDSLQGHVAKEILEKAAQKDYPVEAYFNNLMCKKFTAATSIKSGDKPWCTLTLISHGAMPMGDGPMYAKGGSGKDFFSVQMIEVRAGKGIAADGSEAKQIADHVGHKIHFKFKKNKTFPPYKSGELNYFLGTSDFGCHRGDIDHVFDTVLCGVEYGVFKLAGKWVIYGEQSFDGQQNFSNFLRKMPPDEFAALREKIFEIGLAKESGIEKNSDSFESKGGGEIGSGMAQQPAGEKAPQPPEGKRKRGRPKGSRSTRVGSAEPRQGGSPA